MSAAVQLGDLNDLNNQPMHPDVKTMDLCVEKGPVMASYFDFFSALLSLSLSAPLHAIFNSIWPVVSYRFTVTQLITETAA